MRTRRVLSVRPRAASAILSAVGLFVAASLSVLLPAPARGAEVLEWSRYDDGAPFRFSHAAVYDEREDRLLILGGEGAYGPESFVQALPLAPPHAWRTLHARGEAPSPRHSLAAVFDPKHREIYVVGGAWGSQRFREIWVLQLNGQPRWRQLRARGEGPAELVGHSAVLDDAGRRLLIFGDGTSDVWELSIRGAPEWKRLEVAGEAPRPRTHHAAVFDDDSNRMLVIGGACGFPCLIVEETWALALDGIPTWTRLEAGYSGGSRSGHFGVCDARSSRVLIFGGYDVGGYIDTVPVFNDVLALPLSEPGVWTRITQPAGGPPGRATAAGAVDTRRHRLIVQGGVAYPGVDCYCPTQYPFADTWVLDLAPGGEWTRLPTEPATPLPRLEPALVFDPGAGRFVVFGGGFWHSPQRDLWNFSTERGWYEEEVTPGPPALTRPRFLWDPSTQQPLLVGRTDRLEPIYEVWSLYEHPTTSSSWKQVAPYLEPPAAPSDELGVALDPQLARLYFSGGFEGSSQLQVYAVNPSTRDWTLVQADGNGPSARTGHASHYDPIRRRLFVIGGRTRYGISFAETWVLDLSGRPGPNGYPWRRLDGSSPSGVLDGLVSYDPERNQLLLPRSPGSGPRALPLGEDVPAWQNIPVRGPTPRGGYFGATAFDPAERQFLHVPGTDYDRFFTSTWIGRLVDDGESGVERTELGPTAGDQVAAPLLSEADAQFHVSSVNRASDGIRLRYALPPGTALSIEVIDVRGRRQVGADYAGGSAASVVVGRGLSPGVYFVRFRYGDGAEVRRTVVLP